MLEDRSPEDLNKLFRDVAAADIKRMAVPEAVSRWLFAERLAARNERREMSFEAYEGPGHIRKFFGWLRAAHFPDYFPPDLIEDFVKASFVTDKAVFDHYGLARDDALLAKVARYNAQDYLLQRAYAVPDRQRIRTLLDFGAGHGRMANLALRSPRIVDRVTTLIAVDAIPSTYFTQRAYYAGLGLSVWDYIEHAEECPGADQIAQAMHQHEVVHLPTWCLPLLPAGLVDMVCCIQVLKELPGELIPWLLPHFARLTQPTGALYIRDHLQFHNPNHMPIDLLIQAAGFALEFAPMVKDRSDLHGLPRIWRRVDPSLFI